MLAAATMMAWIPWNEPRVEEEFTRHKIKKLVREESVQRSSCLMSRRSRFWGNLNRVQILSTQSLIFLYSPTTVVLRIPNYRCVGFFRHLKISKTPAIMYN